jgi:uncharacterized RDD family membrane protein YckC
MPAGFWRRYAAYSLDFALLGMISTLLVWSRLVAGSREISSAMSRLSELLSRGLGDALMQGATPAQLSSDMLQNPAIEAAADAVQAAIFDLSLPWLLCYAVLAALYHIGAEQSHWQGSPGKHALDLVVVDAGVGQRAALPRITVRHFAGALSWLTLNLGHALAALPPQKRALHDYIAGTRVITTDTSPHLPPWARVWLALQVVASLVALGWLLLHYIAALQASLA